jgi:hypothetical protein
MIDAEAILREREHRRNILDHHRRQRELSWRGVKRFYPREQYSGIDDDTLWCAVDADTQREIMGIVGYTEYDLCRAVIHRCPNAVRVDPHGGRFA